MTTHRNSIITAERARELLRYDPETGKLFWRVSQGRAGAGAEAGRDSGPNGHRYRQVQIDGRRHFSHRLAWLIVNGIWPADEIDHIDGNGLNNCWNNLREVQHSRNLRNTKQYSSNTSGIMGVCWHKACRKWQAQIRVDGAYIYLGCFDDLAAATEARKAAERRYGFHANHGRLAPPPTTETPCNTT